MVVYIGIDWSEKKHDIEIQDEHGKHLLQLVISHDLGGFLRLEAAVQEVEVLARECIVGLETAHNLLIDFLWDRGYEQIYVLPPNLVKSSQGRTHQSGTRSDPNDAGLIAELIRTDRHRLYPWQPGSPLLQQMRAKLRLASYLTRAIVQTTNRLRSVLLRYYPVSVQVFSDLDTKIALAFIETFPTPQMAQELSWSDFEQFARQQGYSHRSRLPICYARLQAPQPEPTAATLQAYQGEAVLLARQVKQLVDDKNQTLRELQHLYEQHPDRYIFDSLPQAGTLISAGLLVKFGEDRLRFPNAALVQALAGTCPVTRQSGRSRRVSFRKACDHEFRYLSQSWARLTIKASPWAADYYRQIRPHCNSESHAYRCLANRWLGIVWKMWQDRVCYNETYHVRRRAERMLPHS